MTEGAARVPLDQCISRIRAGTSVSGEVRPPTAGEVGILTLAAVSSGRFDPDACKAVPSAIAQDLGPAVRAGTLLMSRSNTIDLVGSAVFVEQDRPDRYLPDLIWEIEIRDDSPLSPRFLVDYLATSAGRRLLQSAAMGTSGSMKKLSMKRLRALDVPRISHATQRTWENYRSRLDEVTGLLTRLLRAKRELKRGLMKALVTGLRRFPEFTECDYEDVRLNDVCRIAIGGTPRRDTPEYWAVEPGLPWASISDLTGRWLHVTAENITQLGAQSSSAKLVPAGTTLMSFKLTIGRVARAARDLYTNEAIAAFYPRDGRVSDAYLYEVLPLAVKHASPDLAVKGATLNKAKLAEIPLRLPSRQEQARIAGVGEVLDHDIHQLEQMLLRYEALKRGLMQQLLSGRLKLPVDSNLSEAPYG